MLLSKLKPKRALVNPQGQISSEDAVNVPPNSTPIFNWKADKISDVDPRMQM